MALLADLGLLHIGPLLVLCAWLSWKFYVAYLGQFSKIPGPSVARWTNLWLKYVTLNGSRMQYVQSLHEKYGPVVRMSPREVAVNDYEAVKKMVRVDGGFDKAPWYDMTGPGLLRMRNRSEHSRRRRLLAHPMSNSSLPNFEPLIRAKVDLAIQQIKKENDSAGAADIFKWFSLMATDVIADLTFGSSFRMLEQGKRSDYVNDLQEIMKTVNTRNELYPLLDILAYIPLPGTREMSLRFQRVGKYGKAAMERLRRAHMAGGLDTPIFFEHIINSKNPEEALTEQEMEEEAAEFMVTGTDTTSNTLTFLTWAILKHPAVRDRLEKEVAQLNEGYRDSDLTKLEYLTAVVQEGLRLYGAAGGSHPRSVPKAGWHVENYYLPGDSVVIFHPYCIHRQAHVFEDVFSFKPERWLDPTKEMKDSYLPFSAGPRTCLGVHLAYMEIRMITAAFFRAFKGATIDKRTTDDDMTMQNYTLIAPKGQKCLVNLRD